MNDEQQVEGLIRRAGGTVGHAPDFDEIYRRSRRRRTARTATAVVTVVALVVVAGVAINAIPIRQTIRFAQTGREPAVEVGSGAATSRADAAMVEGSFRATVKRGRGPADIIDVVDGRVHARAGTPREYFALAEWRGFGDDARVVVDEQIVSGEETYVRARARAQGPARWYRYTGSLAGLQPGLTGTTLPVFTEGTHGFSRVEDAEAAAQGLTRYSADVAAADLDFLAWFAPMPGTYEGADASIDIWVDASGRVHRIKEVLRSEAEYPNVTRFDRFDALGPIALPFGEGDEVPVAADVVGAVFEACGDPRLGDALSERVRAELDGDEDVASYEILDVPAWEQADNMPVTDDPLFIVAVRFGDDVSEGVALEKKMQRLTAVDAGSFNEGSSDSQGHAWLCGNSLASWIELDG